MATGGWGSTAFVSNPFDASSAAQTRAEDADEAPRTQPAYGAWGPSGAGATSPPPPAITPPPPAANGGGGLFGAFGSKKSPAPPTFDGVTAAAGTLGAREAALAQREAELARREAELARLGAAVPRRNWPPCYPITYHNISEEIPAGNRAALRTAYLVELLTLLAFIYNLVVTLAAVFAGVFGPLQWWFIGVIAFLLGAPGSWVFWYRSFYNAAQTDGGTYSYMKTFLLIILHITWAVWMVLALDGLGSFSAGIFPMLRLFSLSGAKGYTFGVLYIVNVVLWGLVGLGGWVVLGLAIAAYRRGGRAADAAAAARV